MLNCNVFKIFKTIPDFAKIYHSSGIRLTLSSDARSYREYGDTTYDPCCRYYFKINGAECSNPGPIEGITHLNKQVNLHRPILGE